LGGSARAKAGPIEESSFPAFEYHDIGRIGNQMGQTSLVDIDKDGRLDRVVGCNHGDVWPVPIKVQRVTARKSPKTPLEPSISYVADLLGRAIWWFQYKGPDEWVRHKIGSGAGTEVGGAAFDVDGDGWIDQVSGSTWYRNPGNPEGKEFTKYSNGAIDNSHDCVAADIDQDGKLEVVQGTDRPLMEVLQLYAGTRQTLADVNSTPVERAKRSKSHRLPQEPEKPRL